MAAAWARQGQQAQARRALDKAMQFSEQLEGMLSADEVPRESQERCMVQLFSLYIEAAKNATDAKQQVRCAGLTGGRDDWEHVHLCCVARGLRLEP